MKHCGGWNGLNSELKISRDATTFTDFLRDETKHTDREDETDRGKETDK